MSQFYFKNFKPDESLKSRANIVLSRILDMSPYGSNAIALLEKDECGYRCTCDISSYDGPFVASIVYTTPNEALSHIEQKITEQIHNWRKRRFKEPTPKGWGFLAGSEENIHKASRNLSVQNLQEKFPNWQGLTEETMKPSLRAVTK